MAERRKRLIGQILRLEEFCGGRLEGLRGALQGLRRAYAYFSNVWRTLRDTKFQELWELSKLRFDIGPLRRLVRCTKRKLQNGHFFFSCVILLCSF